MIDAMVFAAGLGTRLRPITDAIPKALVQVGGMSVLERTVRAIAALEPETIVVNAHHHAEQITSEVHRLDAQLAPRILLSLEVEGPLETGGGLRHASRLFRRACPVLLHNSDVITDLDLGRLVAAHEEGARSTGAVATLAVQDRPSGRKLLFDSTGLYGRRDVRSGREEIAREPAGASRDLAFAGIHVVESGLVERLPDRAVFSITDHYLHLAAQERVIRPFDMGAATWWEIGTPERLAAAREALGA